MKNPPPADAPQSGLSLAKTKRRMTVFTCARAAVLGLVGAAHFAAAQTYTVTDVSAPGVSPSFATGVNASGQVSLYSLTGANAAHAWRFTSGTGWTDLGSFGGADSRATGINDAGTVTGYSRDAAGLAHGFIFSTATGLLDIGGLGNGEGVFPQHINTAGQAAGFSPLAGNDRAFRFSPPNVTLDLGTIPGSSAPAEAAAYGLNDAGRAAGIASSPSGFNRAFRTALDGTGMTDLGTLGGDESWAYAINNIGDVVGSASSLSTDTHAFLYTDSTGMTDLQTLGGYTSTAFAVNNAGHIVGSSEILSRALHAFVWTAAGGMRDLNDIVPINSGWVLTEARAVNDSGVIVGNGLLNGQPRAFLLTPGTGADTAPPLAITKVTQYAFPNPYAVGVQVVFWDNVNVSLASIGSASVRVTGPNGFDQLATFQNTTSAVDAMKITANYYILPPAGGWSGAANGTYAIAIEPSTVRDAAGNFMPAGPIGTFTVALELKPVFSLLPATSPVMNEPVNFTLTAQSSFPYTAADGFAATIDWGDGSAVQTVNGATGTPVPHTFNSTGSFTIRTTLTDLHGVAGDPYVTNVFVSNPAFPQVTVAAPVLTGNRHSTTGLNAGGTILSMGGPVKGGKATVEALAPGATLFVELTARMAGPATGFGTGIDSLNRIIVFGGIDPGANAARTNGYVYSTTSGAGAAIAAKHFAVHDFAFATDSLHRVYSIGGATGAGTTVGSASVERYDAATNTWTTLAPLPAARVSATATCDAHGHIIVIGGSDPAGGVPTATVFSYDIAANTWSQLGNAPGAVAGTRAVLGADGLVYAFGGYGGTQIYAFDSVANSWFAGPFLSVVRSGPAVALGNDGFVYVMGGDSTGGGNTNGLNTSEKFDTGARTAPEILSYPGYLPQTVMVGNGFAYQAIASGNPRPVFSLTTAPTGMTIDATTGVIAWTPAANQTGNNNVTVRASSTAGVAQQTFAINVIPIPTQTDFTEPTVPGSPTLTFRSATSVTMTWSGSTDNVGLTGYKIYGLFRRSGRGGGTSIVLLGTSATRSFIASGGSFSFAVSAVDAAGNESARSPFTSGATLTRPVIAHIGLNEPATVIAGNSFLYTLTTAANPSPTFTTLTGPGGMTLQRTGGPVAGSDYAVVQWQPTLAQVGTFTFTVAAANANTVGGTAVFSVTVLPNGIDTIPPTPVAQLTASAIAADGCTLSWTPAGDNIGVTNYKIVATHFGLPGQPNHVVTLNLPGTSLTTLLTGLLPAAGYTVSITPSDAALNAGPSTMIFINTGTPPPPPPPQTILAYAVADVSPAGGDPSFATGVNAGGQVSLYSTSGASVAHAWRFTPGTGTVDLGTLGGTDSRTTGINDAGTVTGYSRDAAGLAYGFIFSTATGMLDIGGLGSGEGTFPQHINTSGQAAGFSPLAGNDRAFRFSPPNLTLDLGTIPGSTLPAAAAAYGVNDSGRVVGIASSVSGFNHAFRTALDGTGMTDLGTLGGDESWAFAISNAGSVVGTSASASIDTHAFLFTDAAGMKDLETLGGYTSTAFALNNTGTVVGTAETPGRALHAFVWTAATGMRDLNDIIAINSGWVLTEARAINDAGVIAGNGLLNGQPRAFLLTPDSGADTTPPTAITKVSPFTFVGAYAISVQVVFWDNVKVAVASIGSASVRVTGPNGFDQPATFANAVPAADAQKITANFSLAAPATGWNGAANGVYSIAIEPSTVRDAAGNFMPAGIIGTFTVALELKPVFSLLPSVNSVMNVATDFTLGAQSSFPHAPGDGFAVTIDWNGDGSDVQTVNGPSGTVIPHTYTSTGGFALRATLVDLHGLAGEPFATSVFVGNPPSTQAYATGPQLPGSHRLSVGVNANGTIVNLGGLPIRGNRSIVDTLAPGANAFVDSGLLANATQGIGAGFDALNRIIVFGGIAQDAVVPTTGGYVYTINGATFPAIAAKHFAVHDFAFAADAQRRLYAIGGAGSAGLPGEDSMGVERYDATTNSWTTLAPLPAPRVNATAAFDAHGHIIVIGGTDAATGFATNTVFSYDIATNGWVQLGDAPGFPDNGRVAALGADGLIYVLGGNYSTSTFVFDSAAGSWYAGPNLNTARSTPALALGNDGLLYVMGGGNPYLANNGLDTVEKIDTNAPSAPRIVSSPLGSVMVGNAFGYQAIATGNPRPTFSLPVAPSGMTINATTGVIGWTPAANQAGNNRVTVSASSAAGTGSQTFVINVIPIPTQTDFTPPTAPASITLTFRSATSVTMTWPEATDDVGVVGYQIYGLFRGSRSSHIGLIGTSTTRSFISGSFASAYYVAAVDAAGNRSPFSPGVGAGSLTLPNITHANYAEPATVIAGNSFFYTLSAAANPSPTFATTITGPAGMTISRTNGPVAGNDYAVVQWQPTLAQVGAFTFTVSATNPNTTGGTATFSVTVLPAGTDTVAPTPVAQMTASAISFDSATLSWTPAGDNIGVTNYHLVATHFGLPGQPNHVITLDVPGTTLTTPLSVLLPGAGYTVSIRASDAAGNTGPVTQMFFTTLLHPFPPGAELPHLSAGTTLGTLSLDWTNPTGQWRFTVETTDSLSNPNWQPVPPANQWPSTATHFTITHDPLLRQAFFRVTATP